MPNSLQPHGQQHIRPPCPSPSPEVCPSSCLLHRWCHPAISSSDALFSFLPSTQITHITHSQIRLVLGFPDFTCSQPWLHVRKTQRVCLFVWLVGGFVSVPMSGHHSERFWLNQPGARPGDKHLNSLTRWVYGSEKVQSSAFSLSHLLLFWHKLLAKIPSGSFLWTLKMCSFAEAGPVVKTLSFRCRGCRFKPWSKN